MKNFLKPTKITWVVIGLFIFLVLIGFLFSSGMLPDFGMLTNIFVGIALIVLLLPAVLFDRIGIPALYPSSGAFLALPNPTPFGFILSITASLIIFYLLASLVSLLWYKFKSKKSDINLSPVIDK